MVFCPVAHILSNIPSQNKSPKWKGSIAKDLLEKDVADGIIDGLKPAAVYTSRPKFGNTSKAKFASRLRTARLQHKKTADASKEDKIAYDHDRLIHPIPLFNHCGKPRWDGSEAQAQLCCDMDAGKHKTMQPKELWATHEAYQGYDSDVFRKHICQEKKMRKFYNSINDRKIKLY